MANFIRSHFLLIMLIISTIITYVWITRFKEKLVVNRIAAAIISILFTITGVLCVMIFAVVESFSWSAWGQKSLFGAVLFLPILLLLTAKITHRDAKDVLDIFTIPTVISLLVSRLNCVVAGCCKGIVIPGTNLRVPIRGIELVYYLVFCIIISKLISNETSKGKAFPLFMVTYGILRFIIQFFREEYTSLGIVHLPHLWAAISITVGAAILLISQEPKTKGRKRT